MGSGELLGEYVSGVPHGSPRAMRWWLILVVVWMTVLAALSIVLRLVSRRIRKQRLWWDDYSIIFSMAWNIVVIGIGLAMFLEGTGYHAWQLPDSATVNISRWLLVTEIVYVWNLCWTKLSVLAMYYRIFHFRFFKLQVFAVGTFVVTWALTISFLFTFICVPVKKLWLPNIPGHCISELGVWLANAGATIFSDIVILCLPMPQLWNLQLRKIEKFGLMLVFGLGFFVVFASSFRTWVLFNYSKNDVPYTLAPLLVWSEIEMSAGIISACLPTLLPVITIVTTKFGISRALKHTYNVGSTSVSRQNHHRDGSNNSRAGNGEINMGNLRSPVESTRRGSNGPFYSLPDVSKPDDIFVEVSNGSSESNSNSQISRAR